MAINKMFGYIDFIYTISNKESVLIDMVSVTYNKHSRFNKEAVLSFGT